MKLSEIEAKILCILDAKDTPPLKSTEISRLLGTSASKGLERLHNLRQIARYSENGKFYYHSLSKELNQDKPVLSGTASDVLDSVAALLEENAKLKAIIKDLKKVLDDVQYT